MTQAMLRPTVPHDWTAAAIGQIDAFLRDVMPAADVDPAPLHAAMTYGVFSGGKRLRPLLPRDVAGCRSRARAQLLADPRRLAVHGR